VVQGIGPEFKPQYWGKKAHTHTKLCRLTIPFLLQAPRGQVVYSLRSVSFSQALVAHTHNPTQEAETRSTVVQSKPGQIVCETLSQRRADVVAQEVGLKFKSQYHKNK
jgi:hypothetical protein